MTNKDDVARMAAWHDGSSDKLAVDFGGGRGIYYYDGSWLWMRNTDNVAEMRPPGVTAWQWISVLERVSTTSMVPGTG